MEGECTAGPLPGPAAHYSVSVRRYWVQSVIFFSWLEFNLSEHMGHVLSLFSKLFGGDKCGVMKYIINMSLSLG